MRSLDISSFYTVIIVLLMKITYILIILLVVIWVCATLLNSKSKTNVLTITGIRLSQVFVRTTLSNHRRKHIKKNSCFHRRRKRQGYLLTVEKTRLHHLCCVKKGIVSVHVFNQKNNNEKRKWIIQNKIICVDCCSSLSIQCLALVPTNPFHLYFSNLRVNQPLFIYIMCKEIMGEHK
jgi:hypothetical protein